MIKTFMIIEFVLFIIMTGVIIAHIIYMNKILRELEKELEKLKQEEETNA